MTPRYDMEMLKQRCDEILALIAACRKHGAASWLAWRYDHLEREVREFRDVVFRTTRAADLPRKEGE